MRYRTGLVVGRFQPFHKGHLYLVKKASGQADKLIIVVGSTNKKDERNPYSFKERERQIRNELKKHRLLSKKVKIIPQPDHPDDDTWFGNLKEKTGEFDVAFGNNDWVNSILRNHGYKVVSVPFYKRHIYEGTKIRKHMKTSE